MRRCTCRQLSKTDVAGNAPEDDLDVLEAASCRRQGMRILLFVVYTSLALLACLVSSYMVYDLVISMNNPVTSVSYERVENYTAPGIAIYPGGAEFPACAHNYNNVVSSKVRLSALNLTNRSCLFMNVTYSDPHHPDVLRQALVIRGPTNVEDREAVFLHFYLEDESRDFYTVSYFIFPDYDKFAKSDRPDIELQKYHQYVPTFALSAGLRMWIKLSMKDTNFESQDEMAPDTEFKTEYSVVKFVDRRSAEEKKRHLFFIFFEWKNNMRETATILYTTSPWRFLASLCAVFLTVHKGIQLAKASFEKMQKTKRIRKSVKVIRQNSSQVDFTVEKKKHKRKRRDMV